MNLTNTANVNYIQVLPDGSLSYISKTSNQVETSLYPIPVQQPIIMDNFSPPPRPPRHPNGDMRALYFWLGYMIVRRRINATNDDNFE